MKKLFSVMLVLALCGFASAAVDIYLTDATGASEITLFPSDYIELLVWYAGDPITSFDLEALAEGPGTILGGTITAGNRNTNLDWVAMPGGVYEYDIELSATQTSPLTAGVNPPLARILFHCDGIGDVTVGLYDIATLDAAFGVIAPNMHGMIIHQIPEPATIALLCLGGLLIRKK